MKIIKVKAIYNNPEKGESVISLTKWTNYEGFDLTICSNSGQFSHISMLFDEFRIIKNAVKVLDFENNTSVSKKCVVDKSLITVKISTKTEFLVTIFNLNNHTQQIKITFNEFQFIKRAAKKLDRGK